LQTCSISLCSHVLHSDLAVRNLSSAVSNCPVSCKDNKATIIASSSPDKFI
jgi:hypothetical protein